jgi:hypothetical protein
MSSSASSGVDYQSLELVGEGAIADRSTCERVYAQLISSSGNKAEVIHLWQLVLVLGSLGENNAPMRQLLANTYCQYCQRMRLSVTDEIASAVDYVTNVSACPVQYYGMILLIPLFAVQRVRKLSEDCEQLVDTYFPVDSQAMDASNSRSKLKPVYLVKPKMKPGKEIKMKINIPKGKAAVVLSSNELQTTQAVIRRCFSLCYFIYTFMTQLLESAGQLFGYKDVLKGSRNGQDGAANDQFLDSLRYLYENVRDNYCIILVGLLRLLCMSVLFCSDIAAVERLHRGHE